jgi:alpha-beta hydrolase superfamily lysophospholipase
VSPLEVVWSQDEMWKRTGPQRFLSRHGRRLALVGIALAAWLFTVVAGGALGIEGVLRLPRRPIAPADLERARLVAARTNSHLEARMLPAPDGALLRAWWFTPRGRSRGAVIALHGQADNRVAMLGLAELLLRDGYRVLVPDARAHGTSGGHLATYGLRERHDLRAWVEWARNQHPDQCVFGMGASMGGAILLQALPELALCAAVAEASFATFAGAARFRLADRFAVPRRLQSLLVGPFIGTASTYARLRHGLDLRHASPADGVARSRVPVLVVHGTRDREIAVDDARALAAANPRTVTLWIVDGAPHVQAWATAPDEYPRRVLGFLATHQ